MVIFKIFKVEEFNFMEFVFKLVEVLLLFVYIYFIFIGILVKLIFIICCVDMV